MDDTIRNVSHEPHSRLVKFTVLNI